MRLASSLSIRLRRSIPSWIPSCPRSRRWARRCRSSISIATAGPTSTSPTAPSEARMPSIATCTTALSKMWLTNWASPTSTSRAPAFPRARCGATTTTTDTKILFLIKWGRPELFHNDHGHGFTRVTEQAGLPPWINANTAIWFDYDGDGLLDLFVGGYYCRETSTSGISTPRASCPTVLSMPRMAGRKYLFHNLGNGKFEEVSAKGWHQQPPLGAGCGGGGSARHRPSRSVCRQRLRRLRTLLQRRQAVSRSRASRPASASRPRAA